MRWCAGQHEIAASSINYENRGVERHTCSRRKSKNLWRKRQLIYGSNPWGIVDIGKKGLDPFDSHHFGEADPINYPKGLMVKVSPIFMK